MMANSKDTFLEFGTYSMPVPLGLFAKNRERLLKSLKNDGVSKNAAVVLQGGEEIHINSTEHNYVFKQESYFMWTFGVNLPGCFGMININDGKTVLFVPNIPKLNSMQQALASKPTLDSLKKMYQLDAVEYKNEIVGTLKQLNVRTIIILDAKNPESGLNLPTPSFQGMEEFEINRDCLYNTMSELRVIKTEEELNVIRYVYRVASSGHIHLIKSINPGYTLTACKTEFLNHCVSFGDCQNIVTRCITGPERNCSVLAYGYEKSINDAVIPEHVLFILDYGVSYCGYTADIIRTVPLVKEFFHHQLYLYNLVLDALEHTLDVAVPGMGILQLHLIAARKLLERLRLYSLIEGNVNDMMSCGLFEVFMPHGLVHFIGLDVHDVGGYLPGTPVRSNLPGCTTLRTTRRLEKNMVVTFEMGCYFIKTLLEKAYDDPNHNKFLNKNMIQLFLGVGGVRIGETAIVTDTGLEVISKVAKDRRAIEELMQK